MPERQIYIAGEHGHLQDGNYHSDYNTARNGYNLKKNSEYYARSQYNALLNDTHYFERGFMSFDTVALADKRIISVSLFLQGEGKGSSPSYGPARLVLVEGTWGASLGTSDWDDWQAPELASINYGSFQLNQYNELAGIDPDVINQNGYTYFTLLSGADMDVWEYTDGGTYNEHYNYYLTTSGKQPYLLVTYVEPVVPPEVQAACMPKMSAYFK